MDQIDRPRFFEGQYLGAQDLAACVDYTRVRVARHELGAHVWGIATGLELVEQPLASGAVQVSIAPGLAWDGYGRPLVVLAPEPLAADLFRNYVTDTAPEGDIVKIWLTYAEDGSRDPLPGFEVCQGDQHARTAEIYAVEAGELAATHNVVVAARTLEAKAVRKAFNAAAPDLFDESVPYQELPDGGALPRWPILLGFVRWFKQGAAPGFLKPLVTGGPAPDADRIRAMRRYIGVVAEEVLGADGRLRLRDRNKAPSSNYLPPGAAGADLLWVEGHARIEGDARLLAGQLEWRQAGGTFGDVPMFARRVEANAQGGKSLELVFAPTVPAPQGKHRLAIGIAAPAGAAWGPLDAKMVVQDDGNVGIGTVTPVARFEVKGRSDQPGTARFVPDPGKGTNASLVHWNGTGDWHIRSAAPAGKVVLQDTGGTVGVGTGAPDRALTVQGAAGTYLNVKGDNGSEELLIGADGSGGIVSTMTNHNLQLRAGGNSTKVLIQADGNVGIGTTGPRTRLEVAGRPEQPGTAYFVPHPDKGGNISHVHWDPTGDWYIRSASASGKVVIQDTGGDVGIGTSTPAQRLHVAGQFLRVDGVGAAQAEVGSEGNGSIVFGTRNAGIALADFRNLAVPFNTGNANAWLRLWCQSVIEVSDARAKANVEPLSGALAKLLRLRGVSYEWKGEREGARHVGLIAQEVHDVVPEAVSIGERGAGISYSALVPVLIEAVKELKGELDALRPVAAQVAQLEAEVARLRADVAGKAAAGQ
jgi:Chaperone of endosialidase